MIIEILDSQGAVITKVANSENPDADVALYGGTSWRPFQKPPEQVLDEARLEKIRETKEHRRETIEAAIDDAAVVAQTFYLMRPLFDATGATFPAEWLLAYDIWDYAKTKINQIRALPLDQVEAYDPKTDPAWPA